MQTLKQLKSGQLNSHKKIKISEQLTEFPQELFTLTGSLEVLDLSDNLLSELPKDFGRFKQLKILFLSDNLFTELPSVIADCPKLEMIGFKANKIETVAENSLPLNTRWLILTDNKISSLPNSMGTLEKLQKCMLAGNKLTELPSAMADCKALELLRISANCLDALPNWLLELPRLSWLAFSGNNFCLKKQQSSLMNVELSDLDLVEVLGEGASGVIYKAKWRNAEKYSMANADVAVKLFKGAVTSDGYPDDELDISLNIGEQDSLVQVLAQVSSANQQGLMMDLIPSTYKNLGLSPSLKTCTRDTFNSDTEFTADIIFSITKSVASALEHLHGRGLCHGDLYAHNILISDDGGVLLTDFGAASKIPTHQKELIMRIEMRALGWLIDDLLAQLKACDQQSNLAQQLKMVRDENCLSKVSSSFTDVLIRLSEISSVPKQ